ncbi:GyrI-like domain-containing protein [Hymenobacter sp. BT770]|uniref:GyrI-like domain-containing protein n=1 Tax=Hymenobacter sp. BT770 TaxID=2886942 RepID=UPI001D0F5E64|nr:GyrI-like domain-containing protein [Hymenobacter sp. BT770]MCC3153165.1 GyrI-like domain-containing protein [Hymenobacter sp. BT770]MDO3415361.1 GyrI-like domain-containing protein [Hymenobacter sp. BT770]
MKPRIEQLAEKKLIGKRITMSLAQNKTRELWQSVMPRRREILNPLGPEFYSMQLYGSGYFQDFSPTTEFEKWATVAVTDFDSVPQGMETFTLPGGLYAVFLHRADDSTADQTFRHIFENWLPASGYLLDDRPHFELLGEKYKNNGPGSEEEIWIPIKART